MKFGLEEMQNTDEWKALMDLVKPWIAENSPAYADFLSLWAPFRLGRKKVMTAQGQAERYVYYVLDGLQRAYYTDDKGREHTVVFSYQGSFSGVADAFLLGIPSQYTMETLSNSRFLRASRTAVMEAAARHPEIHKLLLDATAEALRGAIFRQIELMSCSAEEKFRNLIQRSPHMLQRCPQKYLASYLGMDPATFSRLMASMDF